MQNDPDSCSAVSPIEVGIGLVVRPALNLAPESGVLPGHRYHILVTQRRHDTVFGGYWEFPGGKTDPEESPRACIVRELGEEVGVRARPVRPLPTVVHSYPHGTVRLNPWLCVLEAGSPAPRDLQVAAHRWIAIDDIRVEDFPPANESIVRALRECAGNGEIDRMFGAA